MFRMGLEERVERGEGQVEILVRRRRRRAVGLGQVIRRLGQSLTTRVGECGIVPMGGQEVLSCPPSLRKLALLEPAPAEPIGGVDFHLFQGSP